MAALTVPLAGATSSGSGEMYTYDYQRKYENGVDEDDENVGNADTSISEKIAALHYGVVHLALAWLVA